MKRYTLSVALILGIYLLWVAEAPSLHTSGESLSAVAEKSVAKAPISATTSSALVREAKHEEKTLDTVSPVSPPTQPQLTIPPEGVEPTESGYPENRAYRLKNPYTTRPFSFEDINKAARASLVNILCVGDDIVRPTSGSGVIIDSRGIILTNAHVAQYLLLSEDSRISLSCTIRTGSPAYPKWKARVLYMPKQWVVEHADEVNSAQKLGTGEYDYALVNIVSDMQDSAPTKPFSSLPVDTRERIAFPPDPVLTASYPAELVGGIITQKELYPVTSVTEVRNLSTFGKGFIDAFTLGSTIGAQSGSSGGAVVNAWGYLVGIISTMSPGNSTDERTLRAITLASIDRDMKATLGTTLTEFLSQDTEVSAALFEKQRDELLTLFFKKLQN